MPRPSFASDVARATKSLLRLEQLIGNIGEVSAPYRRLVAEIAFLRAMSMLELHLETVALKILCGARYLDGAVPAVLQTASSLERAGTLIQQYGRTQILQYPKWNSAKQIKKNLKFTLAQSDHYYSVVVAYGPDLNEMRSVRNHIAHGNSGTRTAYSGVLRARLGGRAKISPGVFLISPRLSPPLGLQYSKICRAMVKELCKAS